MNDNDTLLKRLEHVNNWINNCDQKAGILLAFVGVIIPLVLTSDFFVKRLVVLIKPIKTYLTGGIGTFDCCNFIRLVVFFVMLFFAARTVYYLISTLVGKTDYSKFKQPQLEQTSFFFYGSIANMKFNDYKETMNDSQYSSTNDLLSQIYVNSVICSDKFSNYKTGLSNMAYFLIAFAITYILFLFI